MKKVKPFEPQKKGYTIVDNVVFDYIMPPLSPNAWKILCFIIRKTKGWQKEWDGLPYTQIMKGTGIKSSATVSKALTELLDGQYIKQIKANDQFTPAQYALNTALEIEVANGTTLENEVDANLESKPDTTLESKESKQKKQKETNKEGANPKTADPTYLPEVDQQATILFNGNHSGIADPSQDDEQWLAYRDQFLSIYRKHTGLYPDAQVGRPAIVALASQEGADPELWDRVVYHWKLCGWNPRNIAGMIDCYSRKEIPGNGNRNANQSRGDVRNSSLSDEQKAQLGLS